MAKVLNPTQISRELTAPPGRLLSLRRKPLLAPGTAGPAVKQAFIMLRPDIQWKNPVMFVVEVGAFLTLFYVIQAFLGKSESVSRRPPFNQ
jgi:K+-transporting ATPase ATPase B chain